MVRWLEASPSAAMVHAFKHFRARETIERLGLVWERSYFVVPVELKLRRRDD